MSTDKISRGTELLRELSLAFAPSGCEENVAALIRQNIAGCCDEIYGDRVGSVIAVRRAAGSSSRRVMLSAHMDEVGLMIRSVTDDGLLRFTSMMGGDTRVLAGRRVRVGSADAQYPGAIVQCPVHTVKREDRKNAADIESLYIDIGASSKEQAEKYVRPGDYAVFDSDFIRFGEDGCMIKGKALDDRLGCTVMCDVIHELADSDRRYPFDLYFAFTCREELGISGARCAAHSIHPDEAIIFEATAIADMHGVRDTERVARRGEGGVISIMDRSTIYDRALTELILQAGRDNNIPCQIKKYVSGGNDAGHIHKSGTGVRCAAVSAPASYIHTAASVVAEKDFISICRLALAALDKMAE